MKTFKEFQTILEVYKELPVGKMAEKINKNSIHLGNEAGSRRIEVRSGKRNAIRKALGLKPKVRPEKESPGRSERIKKLVNRNAKIITAIHQHDPEKSGLKHALNRERGALKNIERRMGRENSIKPFKRRKVEEAYKDPNIDKINKRVSKNLDIYFATKSAKKRQELSPKLAKKVTNMNKVKGEFENDPDIYALKRMAKIPAIEHKRKKVSEAYKDPDTNKMLNKRKHIVIHQLDPKSDNETYDKVGGRILKIGKEQRKFESDPDLYALDKMSKAASNSLSQRKRSKKVN